MTDFYRLAAAEQAARLEQLARKALALWPAGWAKLRLIKHRENAVFAVESEDGMRAVMRIHRHGYHSDAALRSELLWMRTLAQADIAVPPVISTACGELFARVTHPAVPEARQVDLLGWVEGAPVGAVEDIAEVDIEELVRTYERIGETAARLHRHGSEWNPPPSFQRHAWDRDGLVGAEPFWGRFWELPALLPGQLALLQRARNRASMELDALGTGPEGFGLIHADMVPENVFVDGDRIALLDFDDAGFGWHMFELATALFFCQPHPQYERIRKALLAGYETVRPGALDTGQLPLFLFLSSTTYLGWVHTRSETDTALQMTPALIEMACGAAENYLNARCEAAVVRSA